MALTIPETKGKFPTVTERRNEINDVIRSYEKDNLSVTLFSPFPPLSFPIPCPPSPPL